MDGKEALELYRKMCIAQGEHNERWLDRFDRQASSTEYLLIMEAFADKLNINYDYDLEDFREFDCDEECQLEDRAGFELSQLIESKIAEILLGQVNH